MAADSKESYAKVINIYLGLLANRFYRERAGQKETH
jgi:hypothetical protein